MIGKLCLVLAAVVGVARQDKPEGYHRRGGISMFQSTHAFVSSSGFGQRNGAWVETGSGARFDTTTGEFPGVESLGGFDTFWYNFSLNNPETTLLE